MAEAFGGGMFEITRMQAEGLARLGFEVAIAHGRRPETPKHVEKVIDSSVQLIPLPWTRRSVGAQVRAQRALRRIVREWKPDLIHLMSSFSGLHGVFAAADIPTVYTPQAYAFMIVGEPVYKRWIYLMIESFVASRVTVVGACSLSEGEQARSLPGSHAVVVVPNGIDELSRDDFVISNHRRKPKVVGMGRPLPQRQPEACARILAAVGDVGEVKWIGGGPEERAGTRALTEAGIPMTGWMPRVEVLRSLAESMVYLHWTAWDGLPLSVLEAMALDVVVVASDIGPNREVLGSEQVCRSEREAAELVRRLLVDPGMRERFIENQRERRRFYGAEAMVERWAEVYASLLGG